MKQYRITTRDLDYPQENDCVLDENDPIHEIKKSLMIGGLGSEHAVRSMDNKEALKRFESMKNNVKPNPRANPKV